MILATYVILKENRQAYETVGEGQGVTVPPPQKKKIQCNNLCKIRAEFGQDLFCLFCLVLFFFLLVKIFCRECSCTPSQIGLLELKIRKFRARWQEESA